MKKLIYLIVLVLISNNLFASHGMGGEITWTCSGTSYIFKVKFYRDCNGIPGPNQVILNTNVPGMPNITCNLNSQVDISPDGSPGTGTVNCPTCGSGGQGAVEEFVFLSAPVVLPGTPPAGGWGFWWGDCCRSGALTNISNGGSVGFGLRAKMYPYPGFIAGQCHDNSPYFAEKPSTIICTGYLYTYNHNAVDAELDSIAYSWDSPIDNIAYPWSPPIPFAAPYSVNSQLPGTPTLNTQSGEVTYNPPTGGYFVTVIKVKAYKCGVLAAEIWREINVVLISGCTIPGNGPNHPPTVPLPADLPLNTPWTSNSDTVIAGDTVKFALSATDFDIHPPASFQLVSFNASGSEFGAGFSSQVGGCILPPCATLTPPPPVQAPAGFLTTFFWRTTCGHVKGLDTNCTRVSNTYTFVVRANDDFCPANGITVSTIRITVKRPPKLLPPKIKCASVLNKFGDVELSWAPPTPRDTHATFADYEIWASLNAAGPYTLIDSVYGSLNQYLTTSKLIPNARQTALLGTHAQNSSLYFKMYTRCGCDSDSISVESNIVRTMKPIATQGAGGVVDVVWNPVHNPLLATSSTKYWIYKEFPIGTWTLIDSTLHPDFTYTDPTTNTICDDTITYRIQTRDDSLNCTSWSAYAGIHVINNAPISTITPNNPSFCAGQNILLTANPNNATTYLWSTGATTQSINVSTAGSFCVTLTFMPGGCTSDTCINVSVSALPTASIAGTSSICAGQNTNLVFNFTGTGPWNYSYNSPTGVVNGVAAASPLNVPVSPATTFNYTMTSVSNASCTGNFAGNALITVNTIPTATISGTTSICAGQNANLNIVFANAPGPYAYSYNTPSGVVNAVSAVSPAIIPVSPAATFNYTLVSVSNVTCPGTIGGNATITVNALPTASITGTASICAGQNTNLVINFANAPGPYSFTYNPGGIVVNGAANPTIIPVSPAGTTNYFLTAVSNANCTGSITGAPAIVTVNPLPTATIVGNPTTCWGQPANLTVNFGGAPGPYSFTYNPGNVTVNNANNPAIITVNPPATTNYTLTAVSNANCAGAVNGQATVTVNLLPTAQISGSQSVCAGQPANLTFNFTGTGPWHYTYLANGIPVGPLIANSSPAIIAVNPAVTTTYTLSPTVNDANCTGNTGGSAIVTVNPLPTAQISGNATVCAGTPTNLTINFTGTAPFVYSYMAGATLMGPYNTNLNNVSIPVTPLNTTVYTLTPTLTGAGCVGNTAGSATVTVNQLPSASITGSDTICDGTATSLTISFGGAPGPYSFTYTANGIPVGPINTNTNPTNIPVSPNVNTTYAISNISNANCPGAITGAAAVVKVTPIPTATISGTAGICWGQGTNLQVAFTGQAPFTYSYNAGATLVGPFTTSSNPAIVHVTPSLTTNYTLTPTVMGNGCTGNTAGNALVTVHPLPAATISGNPTICAGDQTDISISFSGTPPFSYRYSDGTTVSPLIVATSNPETVTVSPSSTKTYTLTLSSDLYCTGSTQGAALVTVNPLPTATISGTSTICFSDQTNLNISFTGTGPFNYSYSDGTTTFGPFITNNSSVSIPVSPAVTTTYTATAVSDANCTGNVSGNATITVNQLPSAIISGNPVICYGQSASLTVNFTGTAPFVYSYNDGTTTYGPFTTSNNPATIPVSPIVNTTYHLTATVTGAGCTGGASGTATVTVNQLPDAVISGNPVICNGASTTFNISFSGVPPFNYSYSNGTSTFGPFTTNNLSETISVSPTDTTTYTLTTLSDNNCSGSVSGQAVVTVNQLPTAQVTGTAGICRGNATNLSINFSGVAPYTYSYSNGTNTFGPFTTNNDPEIISVQPLVNTTYSVISINDANCTGNVTGNSATVTVYDLPIAVISNSSSICIGQSTTFSISFTTGTAPFVYKYSDGTTIFGPFTTSNNPQTVTVAPLSSKTYSLTYLNDFHCQGSFSGAVDVTVHNLPTPEISGVNVICDGHSTVFTANSGYSNYLWSTTETTSSITLTDSGLYSVTVTDNFGCVSSTSQGLIVNQTPVAGFSNDTSLTCEIPNINFFNTSSYPEGSVFSWDFGDNSKSDLENPSHVFSTPGTYPITLIVTTQAGCADTLTEDIDIMFYPLPVAEFKAEPTVASVFNSTVNFTDHSQNAVTWNWTFGDGIKSDNQNPKHYYDEIGKFNVTLVVTNIAGCVSEYSEPILITPFYVPNAFTPNADGNNDMFFNSGYIMDVSSYNMSIFNRWGQKVFENSDYHSFWNGIDRNNKPSPEGTYVYTIKVITKTGKPFEYQGTVALIR